MEEKLKELKFLASKIYGLSVILKIYCKFYSNNLEEVANMCFLVEYLDNNIDKLNSILLIWICTKSSIIKDIKKLCFLKSGMHS